MIGTPQMVAFARKIFSKMVYIPSFFLCGSSRKAMAVHFDVEKSKANPWPWIWYTLLWLLTDYLESEWRKNNIAKYPDKDSRNKLRFQRKTIINKANPKPFLFTTSIVFMYCTVVEEITRKVLFKKHATSYNLPFCFPNCGLRNERKHDFPPEQWLRIVFCRRTAFRKCHRKHLSTYDDPIR